MVRRDSFKKLGDLIFKRTLDSISGGKSEVGDNLAEDQNLDMEFCGNEIEPELENLIQNSFEDRMNDLNEVLKNHESRLDQMDFIQNELKRIDTIVSERVSCKQSK